MRILPRWQDGLRVVAELDGNSQVVARFVHATHANVPDYLVKGGITYRILTDHLGSPRLVVDAATGEVAQRMDYDEWGRVTLDTNPGFQSFGFAGGLYDRDTGLVRFGARDYDPEVGRWTARDPILFGGGDGNLYGYVDGNPMWAIDPWGLEKVILFPPNTPERKAAEGVPDTPGVCVVYGHGKAGVISPTSSSKDALKPADLKKIIEAQCQPKEPVQLMSCNGGTGGDDSVAQRLANEWNAPVSGYDGLVIYQAFLWPFSANVSPLPGVNNQEFSPKLIP